MYTKNNITSKRTQNKTNRYFHDVLQVSSRSQGKELIRTLSQQLNDLPTDLRTPRSARPEITRYSWRQTEEVMLAAMEPPPGGPIMALSGQLAVS
ncbi:hypothetical protein J6590_038026 [Homalodisca vitripennis]|nr:hypothetical protein J6590_038026 [Homalodisca vitripennis]